MSQLLGLSFDGLASPSITLAGWARQDAAVQPSGWGFAWYPSGEYSAALIKDPIATGETAMTELLRDWDRFRAATFVCHLRGAAKRVAQEDTLPFGRSYAGRDWVFAHDGEFDPVIAQGLQLNRAFLPIGHTHSERGFCWLLTQVDQLGASRIADVAWPVLHDLLRQLCAGGPANILLTDGEDMVAYRDPQAPHELYVTRRIPPHAGSPLSNRHVELQLDAQQGAQRSVVVLATSPLDGAQFTAVAPGQMLVARRGTLIWSSDGQNLDLLNGAAAQPMGAAQVQTQALPYGNAANQGGISAQSGGHLQNQPAQLASQPPAPETRVVKLTHETIYRYANPVERSTHLFRLEPVHDSRQQLLDFDLEIFPQGNFRRFEDVFGNVTLRADFDRAYSELRLVARSRVRVAATPLVPAPTQRATIPLVWMPWQRQMMVPYLLPPELPEVQLRELSEFAMSFAERQDFDLDETLVDMNRSIYRDFSYVSGSTTLATTPYDVFQTRRGVCQDFANLFICLARLLNIPARYRVGYIFTGGDYQNKQQSDASHAWTEVYLPHVGWRGFDPTNGCLAALDHVRVAAGRNYLDAAPTSGTLLRGGGGESLSVAVQVTVDS